MIDTSILQADWNARALEHGVTKETVEEAKTLEKEAVKELDRAEILQKLTKMEAVFKLEDLFKEAGIACSHRGQGREEVEREVSALKHHRDIVKLRGQNGKQYFTTREMLELEKGILARALAGKDDRSHILSEKTVQDAISRFEREKGFSLSGEQLLAVNYLTRAEGLIKIVQGHAGAGKSTALTPVRYALEAEEKEVIGAALQGKTAKELEKSTGIKSQTIASLLRDLEGYDREDGTRVDPTRKLSSKSIVIIDEAAMVDTRTMSRLQAMSHKAGAKLVLVGDERQVPPVAAGSPFRSLKKEVGFAELTETRRQKEEWQKAAGREIRAGKVKEALAKYAQAGMITIAKDRDEAMTATVSKWAQNFDPEAPEASLLTAFRKVDVGELNAQARKAMQEKGLLEGIRAEVKTSTGINEFQAGDRLFFSRNDKNMSVMNGETGTLNKIAQDSSGTWLFHVKMDSGQDLAFDPQKYTHFQHGYATTINKSQGETVSKTYNYIGFQGLEHLYVQMTRHTAEAHLVMTEDQLDRAAQAAGVDLAPTEKMMKYAQDLAEREGLTLPEGTESDFDLCRAWLNENAPEKLEERESSLDFGLERVESLIHCLSQSREKANALDFAVEEPEKKLEKEPEKELEKDAPEPEKSKKSERERGREREGFELADNR